jgi:cytochrome b561
MSTAHRELAAVSDSADSAHYDSRSISLHWLTAALVVVQWLGAHIIDWFPRGPLRVDVRSVHLLIGVALLAILAIRLTWRLSGAQRPRPPPGPKIVSGLATSVHWTLYALVIAVLFAGVVNTVVRGDSVFGLFKIPAFHPQDPLLRGQVESLHETLANLLLIVAGAHAVAALAHQWLWRDGVLGRMIPSLRRRPAENGRP